MAKMEGPSRPLKMEWLNKTVELIKEGKTDKEIDNELGEYLSFEIKDKTNHSKTKNSLLKIWVKTPKGIDNIKCIALKLYDSENTDRLAIHWCMMLLAFPFFRDVCSLIGKVTNIQETFTTAWLREKLFDILGERTTLLHSVDKMLQTLKYIGAIENTKNGIYKIISHNIKDEEIKTLILLTIISMQSKVYYNVSELSQMPQMFPFSYSISNELVHKSDLFTLSNFGGKIVVSEN